MAESLRIEEHSRIEDSINQFFDQVVACANHRRFVLLSKSKEMREGMAERVTARQQTEKDLMATKEDIEQKMGNPSLRKLQEEILVKIQGELLEIRRPRKTRLFFSGEIKDLEALILNAGDVFEEEIAFIEPEINPSSGDIEPAEDIPYPPPEYQTKNLPVAKGGKRGYKEGELNNAKGVAFDATDEGVNKFLIADQNNQRVQVWKEVDGMRNQFAFYKRFEHSKMKKPHGIVVSEFDIFVTDTGCHSVFIFRQKLYTLKKIFGGQGGEMGMFNTPKGICLDSDGYIYVADSKNNRVSVHSPHFKCKHIIGDSTILNDPRDVATTQYTVVVLDKGNKCVHFFQRENDRGHIRSCITQGTDCMVDFPSFFSVDSCKNIVVSDYRNCKIRVFDKDGNFIHEFGVMGDEEGEFKYPVGVDITDSGSIIVVSGNNNFGYQIF